VFVRISQSRVGAELCATCFATGTLLFSHSFIRVQISLLFSRSSLTPRRRMLCEKGIVLVTREDSSGLLFERRRVLYDVPKVLYLSRVNQVALEFDDLALAWRTAVASGDCRTC